jgi:hypothetical protein
MTVIIFLLALCGILFVSPSIAANVTIEHKSDGCCGQEQIVLCKATETAVVDVFVGNELLAAYTQSERGKVIDEDGFRVRVTNETEVTEYLSNFDIQIVFRTLSEEVSITCDVLVFSVTKNITTNSLNCLSVGPPITSSSFVSIMESKDGVTVSTKLHEVIEQSVLLTLNCAVTLECLNCSPLSKHEVILVQCETNVTLNGVKGGQYMLSLTIFSDCGERIVPPPTLVTLGERIVPSPTLVTLGERIVPSPTLVTLGDGVIVTMKGSSPTETSAGIHIVAVLFLHAFL